MRRLADLRTDLDAFTEVERASLMSAGYLVTADVLRSKGWLADDLVRDVTLVPHDALGLPRIEGRLKQPTPEYLHQLDVGKERFWKVFRISWVTGGWSKVLGPVVLVGLLATVLRFWRLEIPLWFVGLPVLVGAAILFVQASPERSRALESPPVVVALAVRNAVLGTIAWLWAHAYLRTLGKVFAWQGTIRRLERQERP